MLSGIVELVAYIVHTFLTSALEEEDVECNGFRLSFEIAGSR